IDGPGADGYALIPFGEKTRRAVAGSWEQVNCPEPVIIGADYVDHWFGRIGRDAGEISQQPSECYTQVSHQAPAQDDDVSSKVLKDPDPHAVIKIILLTCSPVNRLESREAGFYRQQCPRARLQMQVIGRGRAASRTVIERQIVRTQIPRQPEQRSDVSADPLFNMIPMYDRQMPVQHRKRIARDYEVFAIFHGHFFARQILWTKEAFAGLDRRLVDA